jgi:hypothetical protein
LDPVGGAVGFFAALEGRGFVCLEVFAAFHELRGSSDPTVSETLTRLLNHLASAVLISSTLKSILLSPLSTRLEKASPTTMPKKRARGDDAANLFETALSWVPDLIIIEKWRGDFRWT